MPPSWLFVVVLASALSQETLSFVFGPLEENKPSSTEKPGAHSAVLRRPEKNAIRFPVTQLKRPLRNRYHPPSSLGAISFPTSDVRRRRQLGFFDPKNQRRPNNSNRPKNNGGSGAISFPSDPPAWGNNFNSPGPNRPLMGGLQRPPWSQPPRPLMKTTSRLPRVTPSTTQIAVTAEEPQGTRPTPAPTRAGCNCPSTPEFNPVCGGDRVTYSNAGKLKCANFCGNPVKMVHLGSCITTTTPASTTPSRVWTPPPRRPANVGNPQQWSWT